MHADNFADLLKPLAWIALASFTVGFCGYLALGLSGGVVAG